MILYYNECQKIMDSFNNTIITEKPPLAYTNNEKLPIRHFTLGNGKKHIIVSAGQHSNEIITVTFVLNLMNYLIKNNISFESLTIHFIPILNPEGYLINTSAIRNKLGRNITENEITKFSYEFYKKFKSDTQNKDNKTKEHQLMFKDINHTSIDSKYNILRNNVEEILSNHPKGSIIDWASNGNGIDLNSNTKKRLVKPNEYNRQLVYNNIRLDIPSPIGHPGNNQSNNFKNELEITSLKKLLEELKGNIFGLLNYHSIGGIIYQRPESNNEFITTYNYLLSKYYQEYTIKNKGTYDIIKDKSGKIVSVNDHLRIDYPGNILIELSPMMGNPIGVFGDKNNYNTTIQSNINSFIYTMTNIDRILSLTNNILQKQNNIDTIYQYIDEIYEQEKHSKRSH